MHILNFRFPLFFKADCDAKAHPSSKKQWKVLHFILIIIKHVPWLEMAMWSTPPPPPPPPQKKKKKKKTITNHKTRSNSTSPPPNKIKWSYKIKKLLHCSAMQRYTCSVAGNDQDKITVSILCTDSKCVTQHGDAVALCCSATVQKDKFPSRINWQSFPFLAPSFCMSSNKKMNSRRCPSVLLHAKIMQSKSQVITVLSADSVLSSTPYSSASLWGYCSASLWGYCSASLWGYCSACTLSFHLRR